ncbi:MAG: hypothetical protein WC759_05520 [Candidatus Micrarchaeia archaeon]
MSEELTRSLRNEDVAALVREDLNYAPQYWTPAAFSQLLKDYQYLPRGFAEKLACQPFADEFLERTKTRVTAARKTYYREYYAKEGKPARKAWYKQNKETQVKHIEILLETKDGKA